MKTAPSIRLIATELRARMMLCLILVGACVTMLWIATAQVSALQRAHDAAQKELRELQSKGRDLRDQLGHAKVHLARFETLTDAGAIGAFAKQRRLDEVDAIFRSGRVTPKAYALGAEAVTGAAGVQNLQHTVLEHRLSFEVLVAHELRLAELIERLASSEVGGLKGVEQCELRRVDDQTKEPGLPSLSASCQLAWYRFERKSEPEMQGSGSAPLQQAALPGRQP